MDSEISNPPSAISPILKAIQIDVSQKPAGALGGEIL
jgi:hypothetical protein